MADASFDWNAAGVAETAVGTVLLAGFTGALAWTTSGDVRATWELARLTRKDQLARERPLIIVQATGYDRARGGDNPPTHHGVLHVEIFNAGAGPAIDIKDARIYPRGWCGRGANARCAAV